ncbi:hypothetical protein ABID30_001950 [Enterococcus rotai]|uniref:Uncharacterized protein n=1 Tax=Enterococcus rotai TaxID=118060 RepID=A0A0U2NPY7_9ENTE|nr:hypothetical protein [Enterococcus rotai]ALS36850.1 hypothetical protein ATZ35_06675 [Enterococcus rotai]
MKLKFMLSTVVIMAAITAGSVVTTTSAHAEAISVSANKEISPSIKDAYVTENNVLKLVLAEPHQNTDTDFLYCMYGDYKMIGNSVEVNDKTIAFDIDLNEFAKRYPTKQDKEEVTSTLHLMHFTFNTGGAPSTRIDIEDKFITDALMNAVNLNAPKLKEAYLEHYNILRLKLVKPYESNNSELSVVHGENEKLGTPVKENGKTVAFDINLDEFAKSFPDKKDKEEVLKTLSLLDRSTSIPKEIEKSKIENEFVTDKLMNAVDQGKLLGTGYVSKFTNMTKLEGYKKFIKSDPYADNTLNKQVTTKTAGMGVKYNNKYRDEYTFSLTNQDGSEVGFARPVANIDEMVIRPNTDKFLGQEYIVSATSVATGETIKIFEFTPFLLF